jgi:hypothetical protein
MDTNKCASRCGKYRCSSKSKGHDKHWFYGKEDGLPCYISWDDEGAATVNEELSKPNPDPEIAKFYGK